MYNNLSEYDDAKLYDAENDWFTDEVDLLVEWAEKLNVGKERILDLACGTGRITLPLAKKGYTLLGVDIHAGMLEEAKEKAPADVQVEWIQQDCTDLQVEGGIPFSYMVGNSFQHFLTNTDQDALLRSIHRVLKEEGVFIFSTRFPSTEELLQEPKEEYWRSVHVSEGIRCDIYTKAVYDAISQIQSYEMIRRFYEGETFIEEKKTTIDLRYTYPQELERVLGENGFKLLHVHRNWLGDPLTPGCYSMVVICQKK
ncbi:class I SAM-dependent methyltransferase [Priestia taiwanensis]|uniref:Methyltransferase n=1 Tax=Priestia taiwanensis TaxID=1347902 RepID=A0A917ESQ2_9BACI|nr:class I SAM-dependent methyltransferase [Priestia taiwanensis]MBM7365008.1 ubiquinone/menaquinone biosynthesis C-methylase UbiE [Priestia taiwanensis]GGE83321.1 methyltransferase [Priestia taiwanensis]